MANHLKQDAADVVVGFRLNKIERKFEEFLQKLANAGTELIFTFKKTQTKESDFQKLRESEYNEALCLLQEIKAFPNFDKLLNHSMMKGQYFEFPMQMIISLSIFAKISLLQK